LTFYSHGPIKFSPLAIKDPPHPLLCGWIKRPILFPRQNTEGRERRRRRGRTTTRQSCSE